MPILIAEYQICDAYLSRKEKCVIDTTKFSMTIAGGSWTYLILNVGENAAFSYFSVCSILLLFMSSLHSIAFKETVERLVALKAQKLCREKIAKLCPSFFSFCIFLLESKGNPKSFVAWGKHEKLMKCLFIIEFQISLIASSLPFYMKNLGLVSYNVFPLLEAKKLFSLGGMPVSLLDLGLFIFISFMVFVLLWILRKARLLMINLRLEKIYKSKLQLPMG